MPRVHETRARKDNPKACPQARAGQTYFWWRTRMKGAKSGVTRCSLTRPRPSQLTMSDYWSRVFELQEEIQDTAVETAEDLEGLRDGWAAQAREIAQDQEDKRDNMPQGLQDSDTGQMLQDRADACYSWADDMEAVELPDREDFPEGDEGDDEFQDALAQALSEIAALEPAE